MTRLPQPSARQPYGPEPSAAGWRAVTDAARVPLWLDVPDRPPATEPLPGPTTADLVVVGGGYSGLWTALLAVTRDPGLDVVLLEGHRVGDGASGRNGGFCSPSLTHGLENGLSRFAAEMPELLRLGARNLDELEADLTAHGIECGFRRSGELDVAVADHQVEALREQAATAARYGLPVEFLDQDAVRERVASPLFRGALLDRDVALLDPARLAWGLRRACLERGVRLHEHSPVTSVGPVGATSGARSAALEVRTTRGGVRAPRVALATNAFPPLVRRLNRYVVPVWDYVVATEPLPADVLRSLRWHGREGVGDTGNQFHYYRLTDDDRLVFGGYDAVYEPGGYRAELAERPESFARLATHLATTFPQLSDVALTHAWGGAIDTCSRFSPFWDTAFDGRLAWVAGFTGLGVAATRFGAQTLLDLLYGHATERTALQMVRRRPVPFPPEPLRTVGIRLTQRGLARADRREGRRGPWLRALDAVGMGFDS